MHLLQPELLGDAPQHDAHRVAGRHRLAGGSEEQHARALTAEAVDVVAESLGGALSEADPAVVLVLRLSHQHPPSLPVHVVEPDRDALRDADPAVEQEEDQGVVATSGEVGPIEAADQPLDLIGAERRADLLVELHEGDLREDVVRHVVHPPAPGEERLHLAVAAVLVGGRGAALLQVAEEPVDVLDGVGPEVLREAETATDAAEVLEGRAVAEDGVLGLPLDVDRGQVGRDGAVDLGHGDPPPSALATTSLTPIGDESNSVITFPESPCHKARPGAALRARTGRRRARALGVRRFGRLSRGTTPVRRRPSLCVLCTAPGFLDTSLAVITRPLRCSARAPGGRLPGCGGRGARPARPGCSGL